MGMEYWFCLIGPIDRAKVPNGGDSPPRLAARGAIIEMTGVDAVCSSGWGIGEATAERIREALYPPKLQTEGGRDDPAIQPGD